MASKSEIDMIGGLVASAMVDELKDALIEQKHELAALRAENERLRALINEVEWFAPYGDELFCPWCGNSIDEGHTNNCFRAALEGDNATPDN